MEIKKANLVDIDELAKLQLLLWPDNTLEGLKEEIKELLKTKKDVFFIAYDKTQPIGFAHASLRHDYVEGASTSPTGYLEGIFVLEQYRKTGVSKQMLEFCENFAKQNGATEFASDCELDNLLSEKVHKKLGFVEASRNIHFIKTLLK